MREPNHLACRHMVLASGSRVCFPLRGLDSALWRSLAWTFMSKVNSSDVGQEYPIYLTIGEWMFLLVHG